MMENKAVSFFSFIIDLKRLNYKPLKKDSLIIVLINDISLNLILGILNQFKSFKDQINEKRETSFFSVLNPVGIKLKVVSATFLLICF